MVRPDVYVRIKKSTYSELVEMLENIKDKMRDPATKDLYKYNSEFMNLIIRELEARGQVGNYNDYL